jgi:hypothetical protein
MLQLFQIYEDTGVGLEVSFPYYILWNARQALGPLDAMVCSAHGVATGSAPTEGRRHGATKHELLSELAIDTEVVLRCFRTGGITHAGDRQVEFKFGSYLIDVHKRKGNMRGRQGK